MSAHQLFIVDTAISLDNAPNQARKMYAHLREHNIIDAGLHPAGALANCFEPSFKLSNAYMVLNELAGAAKDRVIEGISINVFGHYWAEQNGGMTLQEFGQTNPPIAMQQRFDGFFSNDDGGFSASCPHCKTQVHISDEESDDFAEAITEFVCSPNLPSLNCHSCHRTSPLNQYHSKDFAVGYLGVTLNGIGRLKISPEQRVKLLKDLGFAQFCASVVFAANHVN
jgi:hypothetical protein